jgi:hypothetical protein
MAWEIMGVNALESVLYGPSQNATQGHKMLIKILSNFMQDTEIQC